MGIVFINSHECHVCVTVGYLSVYAHLCTSVCVFMCVCMCVCARVCVCVFCKLCGTCLYVYVSMEMMQPSTVPDLRQEHIPLKHPELCTRAHLMEQ